MKDARSTEFDGDFRLQENPEQLVEAYSKKLKVGSNHSKYTDKVILSRIIFESGLCTVPLDNNLWRATHLTPPRKAIYDTKTCFHGIDVRI